MHATKHDPSASGPPGQPPALLEAINLTSRTIADRGRLYRNLVVAVSLLSVASILAALVCWRVWPLMGLILLVPLSGGFVFLDSRRVARWRKQLLEIADNRKLDLTLLLNTISQYKHLPANTLQAMLAALPASNATPATRTPAAGSRDSASGQPGAWRILAATAILTVALTGLAAALFWRSPWLLLVALGFAALFVLLKRK